MNHLINKSYLPMAVLFMVINILIGIFKNILARLDIDLYFILAANCLLFLLTLLGFWIQSKTLANNNTNAFIRGIYSNLLLKMFVIAGIIFVYMAMFDGKINIPDLLISMGFYVLYTGIEVFQLMKILRNKSNA